MSTGCSPSSGCRSTTDGRRPGFSPKPEIARLEGFPETIEERDLARYFHLDGADLAFVRRRHSAAGQLGSRCRASAARWGPLWGARAADWALTEDQQTPEYKESCTAWASHSGSSCSTSAAQQARDAEVGAIDDFTDQFARLQPPRPEMQQLLGAVQGDQNAMDAFVSVVAGTMSPVEFFDPDHVGRIMAAA